MKAIYDAARALAYPKEQQHLAGKAFARGSFRAPVREALRQFESANRGIRNRLNNWELGASARNSAAFYELEPQNWTARERLGDTFFRLADAILSGHPHPSAKSLEQLLHASDTLGWAQLYSRERLEALLYYPAKLGLHKDFSLMSGLRYTDQGVCLELRVCDDDGYLQAERVVHINVVVRSLNDVAEFEREAKTILSTVLKDVLSWPEFQFRAMCR